MEHFFFCEIQQDKLKVVEEPHQKKCTVKQQKFYQTLPTKLAHLKEIWPV